MRVVIKIGEDELRFKWNGNWVGIAFADFILAVRRSDKNPEYYFYHEKYSDPYDFWSSVYGQKFAKLHDLVYQLIAKKYGYDRVKEREYSTKYRWIVIDFEQKKVYTATLVKGIRYGSYEKIAPKFYLLKVKDSVDSIEIRVLPNTN